MSLFEHDDFADQMAATGLSAFELSQKRISEARARQQKLIAEREAVAARERAEANKRLAQIEFDRRAQQEAFEKVMAHERWRDSWRRMIRIAFERKADGLDDEAPLRMSGPLMREIAVEVCERYGITLGEFASYRKHKILTQARQEFFWRVRNETDRSSIEIGKFCGGRDHSTVLYGAANYARWMRIKAGLEQKRKQKRPGNGDDAVKWHMILDMEASDG